MLTVIKYSSFWYLNNTKVFISPQGNVLVQWINVFFTACLHVSDNAKGEIQFTGVF